jgi:hypothetical protein
MRESPDILSGIWWLFSALCTAALLYIASAPPIMMSIIKQHGFTSQAPGLWLYTPVLRIIESDFGGPMVWYFNSVWGAGVVLIGTEEGPPWYVLAAYASLGSVALGVIALPFWRAWRRRRVSRPNKPLQAPAAPPSS